MDAKERHEEVMEMGRTLGLGAEVVGTRQLAAPGEGALLNPLVMLSGSRVR